MAFSSPAAMAQAQRAAEAQSMKALQDRREQTRKDFFKGRQDVSNNRLDRRQIQKDLYEAFKNDPTKTKEVAGNLYQAAQPGGKTLAQYNQDLARKYGPTLSEIGGDIRYGLGSLAKAFAEKGPPILQIIKGLGSKVKSGVEAAWDAVRGEPTSAQGTAFPQPGSDTKDLFSSIDTGIAQVDPNNMLVDIAKQDQRTYKPFRVSNMDMSNVVAQNDGLPSLMDMYNFARNPQVNTNYGNFRLDNVLTGNPQMNYGNTVMINGVPVDLSASIGQGGISGGLSFAFNKGGSVDKYNGLGYMFK